LSEPAPEPKRITASTLLTTVVLVALVQAGSLAISVQNIQVYPAIVNSSGTSGNIAGAAGVPGNTPEATAVNIVFLVGFAFAATLALLWLIRHRRVLSFKALIFTAMALSGFILTLLTAGNFASNYLPLDPALIAGALASVAVVAVIGYTIFVKNQPWLSNFVIAFVGAEVGSFFAGTLSPINSFPWMTLLLPLAFAVYDIYAVFKGPLKHLIGTAPGLALNGLSVKLGEFTLGLGDIVFYTMLPSVALLYVSYTRDFAAGVYASLVTTLVIDAGVAATLYLLSRRRLLPGLPIPMLLGVAVVAAYLL
jgi:hypothetical protein